MSTAPPPWPPPSIATPPADVRPLGPGALAVAAVGVVGAIVGVVGALLPAFAGQRVGDPSSAVFWVGAVLGAAGTAAAAACGLFGLVRASGATAPSVLSVVALVVGGVAGFLTLALLLSG